MTPYNNKNNIICGYKIYIQLRDIIIVLRKEMKLKCSQVLTLPWNWQTY